MLFWSIVCEELGNWTFALFKYDYKYDDLKKLAYNQYLQHKSKDVISPGFYAMKFDDPS